MNGDSASVRIRKAREGRGLTPEQVAERVGLSTAWYHDLEGYADEAFSTVSLAHLQVLGDILGLEPAAILGEKTPSKRGEFRDVTDGLRKRMESEGIDADTLGKRVGWDIREVIVDSQELWNFNVNGFRDVCAAAGVDWLAALPGLP